MCKSLFNVVVRNLLIILPIQQSSFVTMLYVPPAIELKHCFSRLGSISNEMLSALRVTHLNDSVHKVILGHDEVNSWRCRAEGWLWHWWTSPLNLEECGGLTYYCLLINHINASLMNRNWLGSATNWKKDLESVLAASKHKMLSACAWNRVIHCYRAS